MTGNWAQRKCVWAEFILFAIIPLVRRHIWDKSQTACFPVFFSTPGLPLLLLLPLQHPLGAPPALNCQHPWLSAIISIFCIPTQVPSRLLSPLLTSFSCFLLMFSGFLSFIITWGPQLLLINIPQILILLPFPFHVTIIPIIFRKWKNQPCYSLCQQLLWEIEGGEISLHYPWRYPRSAERHWEHIC